MKPPRRKHPPVPPEQPPSSAPRAVVPPNDAGRSAGFGTPRGWRFRLLAMVGLPLALLAMVEGGLRWAGYGYPTAFLLRRASGGQAVWTDNPRFGWRFFGEAMSRAPRPLSVPAVKPERTVRVVVLGESAAFGDPQPAFGLPRLLEALLRERYPETRFEVINAAMTAINSHVLLPIARDCARLRADVWVLYAGNNEVVGPFGAGTVFGPQAPPLAVARAGLALKATRTGQWLDELWQQAHSRRPPLAEWGGMRMFTPYRLRPEDPRLARVYAHFERNLEDLIQTARRAGARLVVGPAVVNLRDCPPFASLHREGLTSAQLAAWEALYRAGQAHWRAGRPAEAREAFRQAAEIDSEYAELLYLWGRTCLETGSPEAAHAHLKRARDFDALRFRADSRIEEIVRRRAIGHESEGLFYADTTGELGRQSPDGLPGADLLYEHVHLNFEGNYRLARLLAEQVVRALPPAAMGREGAPWASSEQCALRLAYGDFQRYEALADIRQRWNEPPFTAQFGHEERVRVLQQQLERLRPALTPAALRQTAERYRQARAGSPEDWVLAEGLGRVLERLGDWEPAAAAWQEVATRLPHDVGAHAQLGILRFRAGQLAEAQAQFEWLLRQDSRSAAAHDGLGRVLVRRGQTAEARAHFLQALARRPTHFESLLNLGLCDRAAGRTNEARTWFRRALEHPPNTPDALNTLARLCHAQGWLTDAVEVYGKSLRLDPLEAAVHLELGMTLAGLGRRAEAKDRYREAARLEPSNAEARFRLGFELGREGQTPEAIEEFTRAVELRPDFGAARLNLALALLGQGRAREARTHLLEAQRLEPANPRIRELLAQMAAGESAKPAPQLDPKP